MDATLAWLLDPADPAVRAATLVDLMGRAPEDPDVVAARQASLVRGSVARVLEGLTVEEGNGLYIPKYGTAFHRLVALADMGAPAGDPRIERALDACLAFFPKPDGGMGRRGSHLCVTGNLVRAATHFGRGDDLRVTRAIGWLLTQQMPDGGFHCWPEDNSTGTLDAWEAAAAFVAVRDRDPRVREPLARAVEFLLSEGLGIGSGYAPHERIHWPRHYYYDALVGLEIATAVAPHDKRIEPGVAWLNGKREHDGRWRIDAMHPDVEDPTYSPYAAGIVAPIAPLVIEEAGAPSKWATLAALRVRSRVA